MTGFLPQFTQITFLNKSYWLIYGQGTLVAICHALQMPSLFLGHQYSHLLLMYINGCQCGILGVHLSLMKTLYTYMLHRVDTLWGCHSWNMLIANPHSSLQFVLHLSSLQIRTKFVFANKQALTDTHIHLSNDANLTEVFITNHLLSQLCSLCVSL